MKPQPVESKAQSFMAGSLIFLVLTVPVLAACSSSAPDSQSSGLTPELTSQQQAAGHPPVITRVVERKEIFDGFQYTYNDIYFTDLDGDAVAVMYREVSSSLSYPLPLSDDPIQASVEEQQEEALFNFGGRCLYRMELVLESRIRDAAGNLSEPVTMRLSCTTPPVVDVQSILVSGLGVIALIALLLALGFWLLFRKHSRERLAAIHSTLLLFCLMLPLTFIQRVLHEGGHALYVALHGVPTLLYIHPFSNIPGYARPAIDLSVWFTVLGSLTALTLSLLISLPFWKRCSRAFLPLVMLLPYVAIHDGLNITGLLGGDFRNIVQIYGISPIPFILLGALIFMAGIFLLFAILPLLGLDPGDKRSLFVLPAAMLLVSTLSLVVACLLVPGSPIDREYFLGREILTVANSLLLPQTVFWMILAVFYVTIYRRVHPRLPAWLRSETVQPGWKDLRLPALLAAISVILGLIIIS